MRRPFIALAGLMLVLTAPGHAAILMGAAEQAEPDSPPTASPAQIAAERDVGEDERIAARIRGIFAAIPALSALEISVEEGVVTLQGSVPGVDQIAQAEDIAGRVSGVVTVDNLVERDLAVESNLGPALDRIVTQAKASWRMVPLFGVAVIAALLLIALTRMLAGLAGLWRKVTPNGFVAELLASAIRFIGVIFGLYVALKIMGATALLGALLGIGGVIGIAIGFAVRDTIDNYISSVMLSLRQPFRANDHVVIEGQEGLVVRLTSRATVLMTLDGNHLRIPNSTVFKAVILNYTRNPQRRFSFDLGVDGDDDPVDGMAVGIGALRSLDFVLTDPEPSARIGDVGDSNIVLSFFGWVDQDATDFFKGRSLAIGTVKTALEAAGFALPEPIYRLRIDPRSAPITTLLPHGEQAGAVGGGMEDAGEPDGAEAVRTSRKTSEETRLAHDVRPETHISELVQRERATTGEKDLLDSDRPIE